MAGQDFRAPSNLSRTAGLEAGVEAIPAGLRLAGVNVPDLPQLPSGRNLLDAGRALLAPISGAKASQPTDPVMRRYAELVLTRTGKTLNDDANRGYLLRAGDTDDPLWNQATVQARLSGAATNATGMASPVQTVGQTDEAGAAQQAMSGMPFTVADIKEMQAVAAKPGATKYERNLPDYMIKRNADYVRRNPVAGTYAVKNQRDVPYERLRQWEAANKDFRFVVGETAYQRVLKQQKVELGLLKPETTPTR